MIAIVLFFLCLVAINVSKAGPNLPDEDGWCKSEVLPSVTKEFSQYMDKTVKPCDNFYQYVCGKSNISVQSVVEERIKAFSRKFHQQKVDSNSDLNDVYNKARLHYQSCMDMDTRRKRGVKPVLEYTKTLTGFDAINQVFVGENFDWVKVAAVTAKRDSSLFFLTGNYREEITFHKDSGVPDFNVIESILIETGLNSSLARETAEEIEKFGIYLDSVNTDPETPILEILTFQQLQSKIPDIDWEKYFLIADGHLPWQKISLYSPSYFNSLQRKLNQFSAKAIANYIFLRVLMSSNVILDGRYNEIYQNLANSYGKKNDPDPEWWCRDIASFWIGDAISSAFVKEYFGGNNKTEAIELAEFLKKTIGKSHWSNAKTREELSEDLAKIKFDIGYPDYLLSDETIQENFKGLKILPGKYFESQHNAMSYRRLMKHEKLNTTDPEWIRGTMGVAVFGDGSSILVPAGQFQPPYYHYCFPKAINFGGVGTLITNAIVRKIAKTHCATLDWFNCVPNTEGVRTAYIAYTDWIKETLPKKNLVLPDLKDVSDKQLFFMAYAHNWCGSDRPEMGQLINDALSNMTEFSDVFGCLAGSNMKPKKEYNSSMHNVLK